MSYWIKIKENCSECGGVGVVCHHLWKQFNQYNDELRQRTGIDATPEQCDEWFAAKGYPVKPPEEPTCYNCNGDGEVERWELYNNFIGRVLKELVALGEKEN